MSDLTDGPVAAAEGADFAGEFEHGDGLVEQLWAERAGSLEFVYIGDALAK